jgi:hypothetical protein
MEVALKKNQEFADDWVRRISQASGLEISMNSFLSIEETKKLKTAFFDRVKYPTEGFRFFWHKRDRESLQSHLRALSVAVRDLRVVLFSSVDHLIAAVRVPADCVLANAMGVWEIVEEDLSLATEDLRNGLCLEENYYTAEAVYVKEGVFELTTWGMFARPRADENSKERVS